MNNEEYAKLKELSEECIKNPVTGYAFHEMYSVWLVVLYVGALGVVEVFISPGTNCILRYRHHATIEDFTKTHSYDRIKGTPWTFSEETSSYRSKFLIEEIDLNEKGIPLSIKLDLLEVKDKAAKSYIVNGSIEIELNQPYIYASKAGLSLEKPVTGEWDLCI